VRFDGETFVVRTHGGGSTKRGLIRTVENGCREVHACCRTFRFRPGPGHTLLEDNGSRWVQTPPRWPLQDLPRQPVTVRVVDEETGQPIERFSYSYSLVGPAGEEYPDWLGMRTVSNCRGEVTIDVPVSCELNIELDALDYRCHGVFCQPGPFAVSPALTNRLVVAKLRPGWTVQGILHDADSGKTIDGATVRPLIDRHPSITPNDARAVTSDTGGNFTVHAVSDWMGFVVQHERYGQTEIKGTNSWRIDTAKPRRAEVDVRLREAPRLHGRVVGKDGNVLTNISVVYNGGQIKNAQDGTFEAYTTGKFVSFQGRGFQPAQRLLSGVATNLGDVVLEPRYEVSVRVRTLSGRPVRAFQVAVIENREWFNYQGLQYHDECNRQAFTNSSGRFVLTTKGPVTNALAVHADGFALYHEPIRLTQTTTTAEVVLDEGATLAGRVRLPPGATGASVRCIPQSWDGSERDRDEDQEILDWGTREATANPDGTFSVPNLRPGSYSVMLHATQAVARSFTVRVPPEGRELPPISLAAAPVRPQGFGTVRGRAFRPYPICAHTNDCPAPEPWPFAKVTVQPWIPSCLSEELEKYALHATADESGDFVFTNAPAGSASVFVKYWNLDRGYRLETNIVVRNSEVHTANLLPNWTRGSAPPPPETSKVVFRVQVGDGSREHLFAGLGTNTVLSPSALHRVTDSWAFDTQPTGMLWQATIAYPGDNRPTDWVSSVMNLPQSELVLTNVRATTATLALESIFVEDLWRGHIHPPVWETTISCGANQETNIIAYLPAGSIRTHVPAFGGRVPEVYLVRSDAKHNKVYRPKRGDAFINPPNPTFAFLPAGRYTLVAHDPYHGYGYAICRNIQVADGRVADACCPHPVSGARVSGTLNLDLVPIEGRIYSAVAKHIETGISLTDYPTSDINGGKLAFRDLWPGTWRLALFLGEREMWSQPVVVRGSEKIGLSVSWSEPGALEMPPDPDGP
jgi:hypothetical protein